MIDICRLCGQTKEMTFEHVPPRITFNKTTRYKIIPFLDHLQSENPFSLPNKGKLHQGGIGYYSLCRDCNSYLGQTFVSAFNAYSNSFIELAKRTASNFFEIEMYDFEGLKVLKQTIAMFLAMNSVEFSQNNRELAEFLLDKETNSLPDKYRIFIYLNSEGQLRNIPLMITGNFENGLSVADTEIAFPPLGHVLTINFNGNLPFHHEITQFKYTALGEKRSEIFKVFRLPTYLPFLLDYREKEFIEKTMNETGKPNGPECS
jgi:hypothetical protein